jgi:glycosyltransferase A (GT-A) superfamily protein (DUF2064 family)
VPESRISTQVDLKEANRPRRCVLLFARPPRSEGRVKKLARAEALFDLTRRRVAEAVESLGETDLVVVEPVSQRGASFGERLENAFGDARSRGYEEVVAVPGDVPALDGAHLEQAFAAFGSHDVVLGPSPDGGVWLLGVKCSQGDIRALFYGIPWHSSGVYAALAANAPSAAHLDSLLDVDGRADLVRLRRGRSDAVLLALVEAILRDVPQTRARTAASGTSTLFEAALGSRAPPPLLSLAV